MRRANMLQLQLLIILSCGVLFSIQQDDLQVFQQEPVPDPFTLGDRYPDRDEVVEVRPIKLRLRRTSQRFRDTIIRNTNNDLSYANDDARLMTSRLKSRLDTLGELYEDRYRRELQVLLTYAEEDNPSVTDPASLHYEARTARIRGRSRSELNVILTLAVQAGFDWVSYEDEDYCRVSVIPDVCQTNLDILFLLDQSGSVGRSNHALALEFMESVVNFFEVGPDLTRVGVFTFSSGAREDFDLDRYLTNRRVTRAIDDIGYRGGYTHTALALNLATNAFNNPSRSGARPVSAGIPRVVVLITDGRSNTFNITQPALNLLASGVTVYSVGIGRVDVNELRFIASDPDQDHVFLLRSFTDAASFVQLLSGTTCDTPANVPPGKPTDGECDEDDFRYFEVECPAFTETVIIEQLDIVGTCALYVSVEIVNPSPVDPTEVTFRNETLTVNRRTLFVTVNAKKIVYISIRGIAQTLNRFRMTVYSMLFDQEVYTATVPSGAIVENVIDLDILNDTDSLYTFSITAGNEDGRFAIGENTGVISTTTQLNAQEQDFYNLTVEAYLTSNDCKRGRAYVEITVLAINQYPPVFQPTNPVSIPEDTGLGTFVVTVNATDGDFGINGVVRYSITGGNIGNAFAIDSVTGDISVAAPLNHTILSSYNLILTATDQAVSNAMSGTTTQVINILDVNQPPFFITLCAIENRCAFMVSEAEPVNTTIETVLAGDPDSSSTPNGQLIYKFDPDDTQFIVDNEGQISLSSTLDRETQDQYIFILFVNDRGSPSLEIFTRITFAITDVNDNAPILNAPDGVNISEGNPINDDIVQISAFDADIEENAAIEFTLNGSSFFSIDPSTGVITLVASLDFETATEHNVTVSAMNPDGLSSESQVITFNVINENDNAPIFQMDPYRALVAEHSNVSTVAVTVQADDADDGLLGEVEYSISGGNIGNAFAINSTTGVISVNGDIDRELVTFFTLQVRAQDFGDPSKSDMARVEITVTDINDNAPIFIPSNYFKTISENAAVGTVIGTVIATDADEVGNPNSNITYNITAGNGMDVFTISPSNGSISTASLLDFETVSNYILTVTGTDQGNPTMSGSATVNISIIDVNDMPPNISGNQTVMLSERTAVPLAVAQFTAIQEIGDNNMFVLNDISGSHNGEFIITQDGIVMLVQPLDFEIMPFYSFQVVVSDGQFNQSAFLLVIVIDENDNTPQFDRVGPFNVTEEMPEGTLVGQVTATDGDVGQNGQIEFTIISNIGGGLFAINASTGMIYTTAVLDREALANMNLFAPPESQQMLVVQAEDQGMPSLFSQTSVIIQLLDINDNSPQFVNELSSISLLENIPVNSFILDASATDADLGLNGEISYSLTSDTPSLPFFINSSTGAVTTSSTLDREEIDNYEFSITASDNGSPVRSNTSMVTVTVLDVNDNAPIFQQNLPLIVGFPESTTFDGGSVEIGRLSATDRDIGRNAEIDYTLSPDADPRFIVRDEGDMQARIEVTSSINFEQQGLFNVTVIATDRGEPPLSSLALVIVVIEDSDEFVPIFRGSCDASINESFPVGPNYIITQCLADDRDGENVFYSIDPEFRNPALTTFRLNTISGAIHLATSLDREMLESYQFTLLATSSGDRLSGMIAQMLVTINVTDVNDNAPVFSPSQLAVTYSDPQAQNIATPTVTDDDINENAELSVSIVSVVRTNQPNDRDTHEIIITAEDMGVPSMSANATVVVTNGFPCQIMEFSLDPDTVQLSVATLCSLSNPPVSQDYLLGTEVILDCSAVSNLPVTYQWQLDGSFITTPSSDSTLDLGQITFDDAGSYSCIARTTIGSIQSQVAVIAIISLPNIVRPPTATSVEIDRLVTIPCVSDGIPTPDVTFFKDGDPIELDSRVIQTGQFLVITRAEVTDDGMYSCMAQNSAGTVISNTARLVVFRTENMVSTVIQLDNPSEDGTCHNLDSNFIERLLENTTARGVEVTDVTAESGFCNSGPCYPNPCINDGICSLNQNASNGFECSCPDTFTGDLCEIDVDECVILEPCLFGGSCTNTRGFFSCTCPPDRRGHRCQYQILCDDDSRCGDGETCVETLANVNGFVCDSTQPNETLTIQLNGDVTDDMLSEAVYIVNDELNNINIITTKRQASNPTDFCEPRFISTTTPSVFQLVWGCPNGTSPPSGLDILQFICTRFIEANIVDSCVYPDGTTQVPPEPQPLAPIDVDVTLIILDDENGAPLSGSQALVLLDETQSLVALMSAGLTANEFETSDPGTTDRDGDGDEGISGGAIAGIIIGVVLAIVVAVVIVVIVFVFKMRTQEDDGIESGKKAAQSQTVQALQTPMLQTQQQQRTSTAGGIIENPAFKYQGAPYNTPNITRLDGNTEVVHRDAITRMDENQRTTSTDNLLNS